MRRGPRTDTYPSPAASRELPARPCTLAERYGQVRYIYMRTSISSPYSPAPTVRPRRHLADAARARLLHALVDLRHPAAGQHVSVPVRRAYDADQQTQRQTSRSRHATHLGATGCMLRTTALQSTRKQVSQRVSYELASTVTVRTSSITTTSDSARAGMRGVGAAVVDRDRERDRERARRGRAWT